MEFAAHRVRAQQLHRRSVRRKPREGESCLPGKPEFADVYVNASQGEGDMRGPWNSDDNFRYVSKAEEFLAMDGADGKPSVQLTAQEKQILQALKQRTRSNPQGNSKTGGDLGMDGSAAQRM